MYQQWSIARRARKGKPIFERLKAATATDEATGSLCIETVFLSSLLDPDIGELLIADVTTAHACSNILGKPASVLTQVSRSLCRFVNRDVNVFKFALTATRRQTCLC